MSRQINFYAAPADTDRIHQWLLAEFPGLTLVSHRRGPRENTIPMDASAAGAFWRLPASALVPLWAKPLLQVADLSSEYPNEFYIATCSNPIIEYQPCHWDELTKTVTRSRFYWGYSGDLPPEALRQIDKLFRWVQRNSVKPEWSAFRIFPIAAQTAHFVRQAEGWQSKPNPLLEEHQDNIAAAVGGKSSTTT